MGRPGKFPKLRTTIMTVCLIGGPFYSRLNLIALTPSDHAGPHQSSLAPRARWAPLSDVADWEVGGTKQGEGPRPGTGVAGQ